MEFGNKTLQNQTIKNKSTRKSNCLPPSTNKLKVMLSNADTLTNKLTELDFIVSQENPHIIAINEVMSKNAQRYIYREEFHITGYEMITDPNVVNNTGRGSLIYLHNSLTSKQVFFPIDGENFSEGVFCEINLKDLGIYIDQELSFDKHMNSAVNKANRILAIARKTFYHIDQDMFMLIYKGLIRPYLEYATSVWSSHLMKHIEDIENVQRRATKQIPGISHLPYNKRLKKLNLPTLSFRRARGDMIQVFKLLCLERGYDKSLPTFLTDSHTKNLRGHSQKLFVQQCNKNIRKYCFSHRAINVWNSLPEHIIQSKDVINFERNLDKFWSDQPLLFDDFKTTISTKSKHPHNPVW